MLARFFSAEILSQHCEERLGLSGKGGVPVLAARIAKAWQKASFVPKAKECLKRSLREEGLVVNGGGDGDGITGKDKSSLTWDLVEGNEAKRMKQSAEDKDQEE